MCAFCVFGMTEPIAKKMAEKSSTTWLAKLPANERATITESDVSEWVEAKAADLLKKAPLGRFLGYLMRRNSPRTG